MPPIEGDPLRDDDLHLALYVCYEIHYRGFKGVEDRWEWHPSLLAWRGRLEEVFEEALLEKFRPSWDGILDLKAELLALGAQGGPPLSKYLKDEATVGEFAEYVVHKSAYQLKEADPHAWAIPRLEGKAKAALVEVEFDEFGSGRPDRIHAVIFRKTMEALGLDSRYGAYLDVLPGLTLATVNLMSLFGLHRRWRGAAVGHLAIAEMTSSLPNKLRADGMRRLGFDADATDFFDEHVIADSVHDVIALHDMAGGLAEEDPALAEDVLFGASAGVGIDALFRGEMLECWQRGESSLRSSVLAV